MLCLALTWRDTGRCCVSSWARLRRDCWMKNEPVVFFQHKAPRASEPIGALAWFQAPFGGHLYVFTSWQSVSCVLICDMKPWRRGPSDISGGNMGGGYERTLYGRFLSCSLGLFVTHKSRREWKRGLIHQCNISVNCLCGPTPSASYLKRFGRWGRGAADRWLVGSKGSPEVTRLNWIFSEQVSVFS